MEHVDHIIVGHGLAGATLAVELKRRGLRVVVLDRGEANTSSKVAAGLMTSVTGKRFALTPNWDELWPDAVRFYQQLEEGIGRKRLHVGPSVRLFKDGAEREWYEKRLDMLALHVEDVLPAIDESVLHASCGGIQLNQTGRLDVAGLLNDLRQSLGSSFRTEQMTHNEVATDGEAVQVPRLNLKADRITFCEGFSARPNPWFPELRFEAAKGEMLTIRCHALHEQRTIHANGLWLAPFTEGRFRVGATYDWDTLDNQPTPGARESLLERLRVFLNAEVEVVDHRAAVRPVVFGRQPIAGFSKRSSLVGMINGLGSKGSLLAPTIARLYADAVTGDADIPAAYCLHSR
ncbi:MAG: NAD(P)/FAD-dependent oxidoreductase [Planctomycetaceae bacterium]